MNRKRTVAKFFFSAFPVFPLTGLITVFTMCGISATAPKDPPKNVTIDCLSIIDTGKMDEDEPTRKVFECVRNAS